MSKPYGVTRVTGAEHTPKPQEGFVVTASPAKREKSSVLKAFSGQQKLFASSAKATYGEYLSPRVCSSPVTLVTP
jgi:hypothetical protein